MQTEQMKVSKGHEAKEIKFQNVGINSVLRRAAFRNKY